MITRIKIEYFSKDYEELLPGGEGGDEISAYYTYTITNVTKGSTITKEGRKSSLEEILDLIH